MNISDRCSEKTGSQLLVGLNRVAEAMQKAHGSEAMVRQVFLDGLRTLGLWGGYHLSDRSDDGQPIPPVLTLPDECALHDGTPYCPDQWAQNQIALLLRVIATRQPLFLPDWAAAQADTWPEVPVPAAPVIFTPFIVGTQARGGLVLCSPCLDEESIPVVQSFAGQVGGVLENLRLSIETQKKIGQMASLRRIDTAISASMELNLTLQIILEETMQQLGVDAVDVLLLDGKLHSLTCRASRGFSSPLSATRTVMLHNSLAGETVLSRQSKLVPDLSQIETPSPDEDWLASEHFQACFIAPLISKGNIKGVFEVFLRRPFDPPQGWLDFYQTLTGQVAIAVESALLLSGLQESTTHLILAYDETLEGWARTLELRDNETKGHSMRVTETTVDLAYAYGLPEEQIAHIRRGALLHDIGKMGIPDNILHKPGPLDDAEWEVMRQHPVLAYRLLSPIEYLHPALDIPYCHHEEWDGSGYPRGLQETDIPLAARLFAIVDVWDALSSDRPYRSAWSWEKVSAYLAEQAGKHFDPQIVPVFLNMMNLARVNGRKFFPIQTRR